MAVENPIKRLRKARGWTQEDLADRIGSGVSTVNRLERQGVKLVNDHVPLLAKIFSVSEAEVLGLANQPSPRKSDVSLYAGKKGDPLDGAQFGPHRELWRAQSECLSAIGIQTNDILVVDSSPGAINGLTTGDAVVIAVFDGDKEITLLRQLLEPNLFSTNAIEDNCLPINRGREPVRIVGHIVNRIAPITPRQ